MIIMTHEIAISWCSIVIYNRSFWNPFYVIYLFFLLNFHKHPMIVVWVFIKNRIVVHSTKLESFSMWIFVEIIIKRAKLFITNIYSCAAQTIKRFKTVCQCSNRRICARRFGFQFFLNKITKKKCLVSLVEEISW